MEMLEPVGVCRNSFFFVDHGVGFVLDSLSLLVRRPFLHGKHMNKAKVHEFPPQPMEYSWQVRIIYSSTLHATR